MQQQPQDLVQTAGAEFDPDADRLREECGVFGIFGHPDAAAITALGLHALQHRGQEAAGIVSFGIFGGVRLTVQGRDCIAEVCEVPDECPVLIGQTPLELLDFVVDPIGQRLIGNPDHGGEQMIDLFSA